MKVKTYDTVDGQNPAPPRMMNIPMIYRVLTIPGGCLDFVHQQYQETTSMKRERKWYISKQWRQAVLLHKWMPLNSLLSSTIHFGKPIYTMVKVDGTTPNLHFRSRCLGKWSDWNSRLPLDQLRRSQQHRRGDAEEKLPFFFGWGVVPWRCLYVLYIATHQ